MNFFQKNITLTEKTRGFHIITNEILKHLPEIANIKTGMLNVFIQHTSASLTINENADPDVRKDFESHFNEMVPEDSGKFLHTDEGTDDMTSHIKSSILGCSLNIPVTDGELNIGIWQGIYLCEHRNHGRRRNLILTLSGV
ncbi:MAG: secondary thiamine-phosphate synthase enzyme YjbQ [Ignavibacteria bacterium]|nr:secondary thiamine-phosphate synthase enzyme YjbQ [Ignavibacteria bacterium]